jgi:hypothetical protein
MNWMPISGYEGLYEISENGGVRSLDRTVTCGKHCYTRKGRIVKNGTCKGYLNVALTKNGKTRTYTVHRLVAIAFLGLQPGVARHKDGDNRHNHWSNLQWGSSKDNSDDRERHGKTVRGVKSPRAKLSEEKVRELKRLAASGKGPTEIGRLLGMNKARVHEIMKGATWAHITP